MVIVVKLSFLPDTFYFWVKPKNPAFCRSVVLIDANEALVSFFPLNSETFSLVFYKVPLENAFRTLPVYHSLAESIVVATFE